MDAQDKRHIIDKYRILPGLPTKDLPDSDLLVLFNDMKRAAGMERYPDDCIFVSVPIDDPILIHFGSSCGGVENKIFGIKGLISFLKKQGVAQIIGLLDGKNAMESDGLLFPSIVLPFVGRAGHQFEGLTDKMGGSFRYERSSIEGWSVYESE